jgi:hypothetical protein
MVYLLSRGPFRGAVPTGPWLQWLVKSELEFQHTENAGIERKGALRV